MLAKSFAGGLLGFAAGATLYTLTSHRSEFRADRFSAELMGDGKYLADALLKVEAKMGERFREVSAKHPEISTEALKRPYALFLQLLSHPSTQNRISRLEAWVPR